MYNNKDNYSFFMSGEVESKKLIFVINTETEIQYLFSVVLGALT